MSRLLPFVSAFHDSWSQGGVSRGNREALLVFDAGFGVRRSPPLWIFLICLRLIWSAAVSALDGFLFLSGSVRMSGQKQNEKEEKTSKAAETAALQIRTTQRR
jgi:hypothetical protein